ncbi:MAG: hypothetical protein HY549_00425 [Elusimicrobia bacterium]|nr:hypothetical protein [Elusimicrobiota bacterium]
MSDPFRRVVLGSSMAPLIRNGDEIEIGPGSPDWGDVAVYVGRDAAGRPTLVAHRVLWRRAGRRWTGGDGNRHLDPVVEPGTPMSRVIAVRRGSRRIALDRPPGWAASMAVGALAWIALPVLRSAFRGLAALERTLWLAVWAYCRAPICRRSETKRWTLWAGRSQDHWTYAPERWIEAGADLLLALFPGCPEEGAGPRTASVAALGELAADTAWEGEVRVLGDVIVPAGRALRIKSSARLNFAPDPVKSPVVWRWSQGRWLRANPPGRAHLIVRGRLDIEAGAEGFDHPLFGGIVASGCGRVSARSLSLKGQEVAMSFFDRSKASLRDTRLEACESGLLFSGGSRGRIEGLQAVGCRRRAVVCEQAAAVAVSGASIRLSEIGLVARGRACLRVKRSRLSDCDDSGLAVWGRSSARLWDVSASSCAHGAQVAGRGRLRARGLLCVDCRQTGLSLQGGLLELSSSRLGGARHGLLCAGSWELKAQGLELLSNGESLALKGRGQALIQGLVAVGETAIVLSQQARARVAEVKVSGSRTGLRVSGDSRLEASELRSEGNETGLSVSGGAVRLRRFLIASSGEVACRVTRGRVIAESGALQDNPLGIDCSGKAVVSARDCRFAGNRQAVRAAGRARLHLKACRFRDGECGISAHDSARVGQVSCRGARLERAIVAQGSAFLTMRNCAWNTRSGAGLSERSRALMRRCLLSCSDTAVELGGRASLLLAGCLIRGGEIGLRAEREGRLAAWGVRWTGAGRYGLWLRDRSRARLLSCRFEANRMLGIYAQDRSRLLSVAHRLSGNGEGFSWVSVGPAALFFGSWKAHGQSAVNAQSGSLLLLGERISGGEVGIGAYGSGRLAVLGTRISGWRRAAILAQNRARCLLAPSGSIRAVSGGQAVVETPVDLARRWLREWMLKRASDGIAARLGAGLYVLAGFAVRAWAGSRGFELRLRRGMALGRVRPGLSDIDWFCPLPDRAGASEVMDFWRGYRRWKAVFPVLGEVLMARPEELRVYLRHGDWRRTELEGGVVERCSQRRVLGLFGQCLHAYSALTRYVFLERKELAERLNAEKALVDLARLCLAAEGPERELIGREGLARGRGPLWLEEANSLLAAEPARSAALALEEMDRRFKPPIPGEPLAEAETCRARAVSAPAPLGLDESWFGCLRRESSGELKAYRHDSLGRSMAVLEPGAGLHGAMRAAAALRRAFQDKPFLWTVPVMLSPGLARLALNAPHLEDPFRFLDRPRESAAETNWTRSGAEAPLKDVYTVFLGDWEGVDESLGRTHLSQSCREALCNFALSWRLAWGPWSLRGHLTGLEALYCRWLALRLYFEKGVAASTRDLGRLTELCDGSFGPTGLSPRKLAGLGSELERGSVASIEHYQFIEQGLRRVLADMDRLEGARAMVS